MNKIFATSEEKFVKTVILYTKNSDVYLYEDRDCTVKIDKDALKNLGIKGGTVLYKGAYYPIACVKDNTAKGCTDASIWDAIASAAAVVTFHSKEHTA